MLTATSEISNFGSWFVFGKNVRPFRKFGPIIVLKFLIASAESAASFFECGVPSALLASISSCSASANGEGDLVSSDRYLQIADFAAPYRVTRKVGAYFAFRIIACRRVGEASVYSANWLADMRGS